MKLLEKFARLFNRFTRSNSPSAIHLQLQPLTPQVVQDATAETCIAALNDATSRHDVRNIALTGPYGSGKSSVLLTWKARHKSGDTFLTVSLADFAVQRPDTPEGSGYKEQEQKRLAFQEKSIEYSILQQILYAEEKSHLPNSRIERIGDKSGQQLLRASAMLFFTIVSAGITGLLLFPQRVTGWLGLPELGNAILADYPTLRFIDAAVTMVTTLWAILWQLDRTGLFDRKIRLDKIDLLKGTVSAQAEQPSLLNVCIDEIVYFFARTRCRVVMFEDLDRFDDGRIFLKLREINQIINNTRQNSLSPVRFIYAVRDDLFHDAASRTKFFDLIIPVIPVLDSQNALSHLLDRFSDQEKDFPRFTELLKKIARFIPDMRVMHNITNEFRLYRNTVDNRGDVTKLLAMICYKNLCTEDYNQIDSGRGLLYQTVEAFRRGMLQESVMDKIGAILSKHRVKLDNLNSGRLVNARELRSELLLRELPSSIVSQYVFTSFNGDYPHKSWTREELTESEEQFRECLDSPHSLGISKPGQYRSNAIAHLDKAKILSEYNTRLQKIEAANDGQVSDLQKKILDLDNEQRNKHRMSLAQIILEIGRPDYTNWCRNHAQLADEADGDPTWLDLYMLLLADGFLSVDYMSFRSVFREGALSITDNDFIKAVTSHNALEHTVNMQLDKVSGVFDELEDLKALHQENILHPALLLWLLKQKPSRLKDIMDDQFEHLEESQCFWIFCYLHQSWDYTTFGGFILCITERESLLKKMLSHLASFISNSPVHPAIETATLVLMQCQQMKLQPEFLRRELGQLCVKIPYLADKAAPEQVQIFSENLSISGIRYPRLFRMQNPTGRAHMWAVAEKNLYDFNTENLVTLAITLSLTGITESGFRAHPYSQLMALNIPAVMEYVSLNLDYFAKNLFAGSNDIAAVSTVLSLSELSREAAVHIIKEMDFTLQELDDVPEKTFGSDESASGGNSVWALLIENQRITPSWHNFFSAMNESIQTEILVEWLNEAGETWESEEDEEIPEGLEDTFIERIICNSALRAEVLRHLMPHIPLELDAIPENASVSVLQLIIDNNYLAHTPDIWHEMALRFVNAPRQQLSKAQSTWLLQSPGLIESELENFFPSNEAPRAELIAAVLKANEFTTSQKVMLAEHVHNTAPQIWKHPGMLSSQLLIELNNSTSNHAFRLALLSAALDVGIHDRNTITGILMSGNEPGWAIFLNTNAQSSSFVPYCQDLFELGDKLVQAGYIHKMSRTHNGEKMRIGFR